jgi:hypothetical protein
MHACKTAAAALQRPDSEQLNRLRARANSLRSKIDFNRRNPGESDDEQRQTGILLREFRREQSELLAQLSALETASRRDVRIATREEVTELLNELSAQLIAAASAEDDEELRLARRVIDELTGGRIKLHQCGQRKKGRGWLQGRVRADVVGLAVRRLTGVSGALDASEPIEVVIDYRRPKLIDEKSETAKRLWDEGLLHVEIARQMGCLPPYVTKLIQYWHDKRGLPRPNNKKRRKQLENKQTKTPLYKQIANEVQVLMEAGHSNLEMARQTKTSDTNVAKAISWWHRTRGLPGPTASDRRNKKLKRALAMLDEGVLLTDAAKRLDYSPRGLKLALAKSAAESGVAALDYRTRRGNAKSGSTANGENSSSDSRAA